MPTADEDAADIGERIPAQDRVPANREQNGIEAEVGPADVLGIGDGLGEKGQDQRLFPEEARLHKEQRRQDQGERHGARSGPADGCGNRTIESGRASSRESVWQYGEISDVEETR